MPQNSCFVGISICFPVLGVGRCFSMLGVRRLSPLGRVYWSMRGTEVWALGAMWLGSKCNRQAHILGHAPLQQAASGVCSEERAETQHPPGPRGNICVEHSINLSYGLFVPPWWLAAEKRSLGMNVGNADPGVSHLPSRYGHMNALTEDKRLGNAERCWSSQANEAQTQLFERSKVLSCFIFTPCAHFVSCTTFSLTAAVFGRDLQTHGCLQPKVGMV